MKMREMLHIREIKSRQEKTKQQPYSFWYGFPLWKCEIAKYEGNETDWSRRKNNIG